MIKEFNPNPYSKNENFLCSIDGDTLTIDLTHPELNQLKYVKFNQESVRASDGVRLSYDYDRDGIVIEQASKFSWGDEDDGSCDPDRKEVAFIQSWAREDNK